MFTGIIESRATVSAIKKKEGLCSITLEFEEGFGTGLVIGASIAVDGVCLTVTHIHDPTHVECDIMLPSLRTTTLSDYELGSLVNVERAAKEGAEIGGHVLSGHVDCCGRIIHIETPQHNKMLRIAVDPLFLRYIFSKGYIAINGASLTVSDVNRAEHWFEIWLIPETRRVTTLDAMPIGAKLNIEIDRGTQIIVDTLRNTIEENFAQFLPLLSKTILEQPLIDQMTTAMLPSSVKLLEPLSAPPHHQNNASLFS